MSERFCDLPAVVQEQIFPKGKLIQFNKDMNPAKGTLWFATRGMMGVEVSRKDRPTPLLTSISKPGDSGIGYELMNRRDTNLAVRTLLDTKIVKVIFDLNNPDWQKVVAEGMVTRYKEGIEHNRRLATEEPMPRVSAALLDLEDIQGGEKIVPVTQSVIGYRAGYERRHLGPILQSLERKRAIKRPHLRKLVLANREVLQRIADGYTAAH